MRKPDEIVFLVSWVSWAFEIPYSVNEELIKEVSEENEILWIVSSLSYMFRWGYINCSAIIGLRKLNMILSVCTDTAKWPFNLGDTMGVFPIRLLGSLG